MNTRVKRQVLKSRLNVMQMDLILDVLEEAERSGFAKPEQVRPLLAILADCDGLVAEKTFEAD